MMNNAREHSYIRGVQRISQQIQGDHEGWPSPKRWTRYAEYRRLAPRNPWVPSAKDCEL